MKNISPAALAALMMGELSNFEVALTPGGIEAQEAAGQAHMVANTLLPKASGIGDTEGETWKWLEKQGVEVLGDEDDLFYRVSLPEGWELRANSDHDMWSTLYGAEGAEIAEIFYKAAFYDRSAFIRLTERGA